MPSAQSDTEPDIERVVVDPACRKVEVRVTNEDALTIYLVVYGVYLLLGYRDDTLLVG